MAKKSMLTPEQRTQRVLRRLGKAEPAVPIARRAGISEQTLYRWREAFLSGGKQALAGRGREAEQAKELKRLSGEIAERDRVIGELTIAKRILKTLSGASSSGQAGEPRGRRPHAMPACGAEAA